MAAEAIDYIRDKNGELLIQNGDFVKGDATLIHQSNILLANKGDYKQYPTLGVALETFVLEDDEEELKRVITEEFVNDGLKIKKLSLPIIQAEY